jgi:hypothetical protein
MILQTNKREKKGMQERGVKEIKIQKGKRNGRMGLGNILR